MNYNYHTHTFRCNHAVGTEEEYINRAIENGIKFMGFSDHMPFKAPDGSEAHYRVPVSLAKDYIEKITELKGKYKNKINLKIGFEMEYYPDSFKLMLKNAIDYGAEYLILGQHFLGEEYLGYKYSGIENYDVDDLKRYVSLIIEGMKTGVFSYVAHPDVFNFSGNEDVFIEEMRKICVASKELNLPLEINFLGLRYGRHYPLENFWKIVGEEECPVTFGFDAHDVKGAFDSETLQKAQNLVEKFNLNYIGKPKIVDIRENKIL